MRRALRWLWVLTIVLAYFPGRYWWEWMGTDGRAFWSFVAMALLVLLGAFSALAGAAMLDD